MTPMGLAVTSRVKSDTLLYLVRKDGKYFMVLRLGYRSGVTEPTGSHPKSLRIRTLIDLGQYFERMKATWFWALR